MTPSHVSVAASAGLAERSAAYLPGLPAERPTVAARHAGGRRYRAEIDGLRAIAVSIVVLYHAQLTERGHDPFAGGFIGVDIFLVISGYLIGMILLGEIGDRRFSFARFYERRARRILPAFYVMLLGTAPVAWLLLLPPAWQNYGAGLASAVASVSNIYFWHESGYDAADNLVNPLIHSWSLGLEEQFYLLFPALLLLVSRLGRAWLIPLLWAMCAGSLGWAEWLTARAPDAAFFLLPSRIWELGAGVLLAAYEIDKGDPAPSRLAPVIGLAAILLCVPFMPLHSHHPGFLTLLPVAGTALVIRYSGRGDPVGRLLASRPFVAIGLVSYSLYLWHQPIFVFSRLWHVDEFSLLAKLGWILLAGLFAATTYFFIERPTRDRSRFTPQAIWAIAVGGAVLIGAGGLAIALGGGHPVRFPPSFQPFVEAAIAEKAPLVQGKKSCVNFVPEDGPCHFRASRRGGYNLMLVGDSHARLLGGSVVARLDASGFLGSVALLNRGGCLFLPGLVRVDGTTPSCPPSYNVARMRYLWAQPRAVVVLMMRLPIVIEESRFDNGAGGVERGEPPHISMAAGPFDRSASEFQIRAELIKTVHRLLAHGARVVLVYPVPEMGWNVPEKLLQLARDEPPGSWMEPTQASVSYRQFRARTRRSYALLDSVGVHPGLARVFPERLFCRAGRCVNHEGSAVYYRDDNHLSRRGADRLASEILRTIDQQWGSARR